MLTVAVLSAIVFASIAAAARRARRVHRRQHKLTAAFARARRDWQPYGDSYGTHS